MGRLGEVMDAAKCDAGTVAKCEDGGEGRFVLYVCGVLVEGSDWCVVGAGEVEAVFAMLARNVVDGAKGGSDDWRWRGRRGDCRRLLGIWLLGVRCLSLLWIVGNVRGR